MLDSNNPNIVATSAELVHSNPEDNVKKLIP